MQPTPLKIGLATLALWAIATTSAIACPTSRNRFTDYSRRSNNRCEGEVSRLPVSGNSLRLTSLSSRSMDRFGDNLLLQIPYTGGGEPNVRLLSTADRYQLDDLDLTARDATQTYNFYFSTDVLDRTGVQPNELRARAYSGGGLYAPVLIGGLGTGNAYDIVFYANRDTKITKFEIRRSDRAVYSTRRTTFSCGSLAFSWNGSNDPAGNYQIYVEAEVERAGSAPESIRRTIDFIHDPDWID